MKILKWIQMKLMHTAEIPEPLEYENENFYKNLELFSQAYPSKPSGLDVKNGQIFMVNSSEDER